MAQVAEATPSPVNSHEVVRLAFLDNLRGIAPDGRRCAAPCDVILDRRTVLQPDVFWDSGPESACKLGPDRRWHGPPDLVIEVLSPATALRDRREKFILYEKHGVQEYWIADPTTRFVEVRRLKDRLFQRIDVLGAEESFESTVLKTTIQLAQVFAA